MTEFEANKRRVGENIKKIRIEKGLTQLDVANSVGVTKQTICKIEKTGSTNPHTLERIADALHVDVYQFYEPTRDKDDKTVKDECANFVKEDEMKILIADYAMPMIKKVNDAVADSFYEQLKHKFNPQNAWMKFIQKQPYGSSGSYTSKQVDDFCSILYNEYTPIQYLNKIRIAKAKELLLNTDEMIDAISQMVGLEKRNPFILLFKD